MDAIYPFDVYYAEEDRSESAGPQPVETDQQPWRAFRTRLNFDLAEVMQSAHLNRQEIEEIISIVHRAIQAPHEFTLTGYNDLSDAWVKARQTETNEVSIIIIDS